MFQNGILSGNKLQATNEDGGRYVCAIQAKNGPLKGEWFCWHCSAVEKIT